MRSNTTNVLRNTWTKESDARFKKKKKKSDKQSDSNKNQIALSGWQEIFVVPVNNFSVMSRRSHRFLGITSIFRE